MSNKKIIAICQSGGEFSTNKEDGTMSYSGGEAYALDLDQSTSLQDFCNELAENFQCSPNGMIIKYFLPGNKKILITVSKDKDLKRMVNFFKDSDQVEVFIIVNEATLPLSSSMPETRSSRSITLKAETPDVSASRDIVLSDYSINVVEPLDIITPASNDDQDVSAANNGDGEEEDHHQRTVSQWQNAITGVDQRFNSFAEFREALHKYSIAHGFAYKYKKNDRDRVLAKCKTEGCPWRVFASRLATTQLVCIKTMNSEHTCEGTVAKAGYRSMRGWVGNIIKEKLKVSPSYKPKDIANDIKREYGIHLNYSQARRAKEMAREELQGSYNESYKQLPLFCEKIIESNPGSICTFSTNQDSSFRSLFVSFHALISGFQQGCRPLIFLDSTPLYSKYRGKLLVATSPDGNDDVFPLAFAVIDEETNENWHWFLSQLKSAVSTSRQITFIADFQKGIKESLQEIFGQHCIHSYCLRYLAEKLNMDLQGQLSHEARRLMVKDLTSAAHARTLESFEKCIENIKAISNEASNWVMKSQPENWANAFFNGAARYDHMTSNFGQLFYNWVSEVDELPIIQMVDVLREKIMELILTRRIESTQWSSKLTPLMEEKLQNETLKAQSLQVLILHGSVFEVRGETLNTVDIDNWGECSCKEWFLLGLPCCHAIAVLQCLGRCAYDYCSKCFTTECYRLAYVESINPVPNIENVSKDELEGVAVVTPPPVKRPPGRPKIRKIEPLDVIKRQLQCSLCKGLGHNKKTCSKNNTGQMDVLPETPLLTDGTVEEPEQSS